MAGYFVANYTITNQADYRQYLAAVGPTLEAHGAENIVIDRDCELLEGSAGQVTVVLRFATKSAAEAWYQSPEYGPSGTSARTAPRASQSSRKADSAGFHRFCFAEMNTRLQFERLLGVRDRTRVPGRAAAAGGCAQPSPCAAAASFATISPGRHNDRPG